MKCLLLLVFSCLGCSIGSIHAVAGSPPARIVCSTPVHAFGKVDNSETIQHTFVLQNIGDAPLRISRVRVCCGVRAALANDVVLPGTNTTVAVTMDLRKKRGSIRKTIYVESNDPAKPRYPLQLAGHVVSEVRIHPSHIGFGGVANDAEVERTAEIRFTVPRNVCVTNVLCSHESFEVRADQRSANVYDIRVLTVPPLADGTTRGMITIHTDDEKHSVLKLPITVTVVKDLLSLPRSIVLDGRSDLPVTRYIVVRSRSKQEFSVHSVEVPLAGAETVLSKYPGGGVRCEIKNMRAVPGLSGKRVVIRTDHPREPVVTIPIRVVKP